MSGRRRTPSKPRPLNCAICGERFHGNHSQAKYCSPRCRRIGWRKSWRKYDANHPERRREHRRAYYLANRDHILKRTRERHRRIAAEKKSQRSK